MDTDTLMTADARVNTLALPDQRERLEGALDNLAADGSRFLGRFSILSAAFRRSGGQGIVQVSFTL